MSLVFDRAFAAPYGEAVRLSPLIRRVLANNPGPFTFRGTGTYIVGARDVAVIDPGPDIPEHVDALKRALTGCRVTHILITHTHADHSPAARPLQEWSGATTYGFGPHPIAHVESQALQNLSVAQLLPDIVHRQQNVPGGH